MNVESQRSIDKVDHVEIFPSREVIVNKERIAGAINRIKMDRDKMVKAFEKNSKLEEAERIKQSTTTILDKMTHQKTFNGIEGFVEYFYEETVSFLDYFEKRYVGFRG